MKKEKDAAERVRASFFNIILIGEKMENLIKNNIKSYGLSEVLSYQKNQKRDECRKEREQADLLLDQQFLFCDTWDMEPCHISYRIDPMEWTKTPNGDPEWIFMLNRHDFLKKLLWSWLIWEDDQYLDKLKFYLFDWIEHNPMPQENEKSPAWRTIDTGIRCGNWADILMLLKWKDALEEQEERRLSDSLSQQLFFLKKHYLDRYTLSNWGVLQTTAICKCLKMFPQLATKVSLEQWAWEELKRQLSIQILPDGCQWEQSVMYHVEVLNSCIQLAVACRSAKKEPEWLTNAISQMSDYLMYAAGPDFCQINQGDSDISDTRDVMCKAAVLLEDGRYRFRGFNQMDCDSARLLGAEGIRKYEEMKPEEPKVLCRHFEDAGHSYLRSGWERQASFTYLKNGPLGSSHGHVDQTHISIYYQGVPFLTDSGRFTYREEEPLRPWLKAAQSHNVCLIDQDPHGKPVRSWEYESFGDCEKTYCRDSGSVHYVEMGYTSRLTKGNFYRIVRKVFVLDPDIWVIFNELQCDGAHSSEEFYHVSPSIQVENSEKASNTIRLYSGNVSLNITSGEELFVESGVFSGTYNKKETTVCLKKTRKWEDRLDDWTCLHPDKIEVRDGNIYQYGSTKPAAKADVQVKEFWKEGQVLWVVILFLRETFQGGKLYFYESVPLYGKALVLKKEGGEFQRFLMRN